MRLTLSLSPTLGARFGLRCPVASGSRIWWYAFGYFASYVPFSWLAKSLSGGAWTDGDRLNGLSLLPWATAASVCVMLCFVFGMGWHKFAHQKQLGRISLPVPQRFTAISGFFTAVIIATTTLAYTFEGISIVFAMLLMRGGVLILAPIVDAMSGRSSHWQSWAGLLLCLLALVVAFAEQGGYQITWPAVANISLYLAAYFVRLRLMSKYAKSSDASATKRYFVEEQLVAAPATLLLLLTFGWLGGESGEPIRQGLSAVEWGGTLFALILAMGVFSQLVGIFGSLIFLDKRENTFSVPVNRCSSVLSGVVASWLLALSFDMPWPSNYQLAGALCIVLAIVLLSIRSKSPREAGAK